MMVENTYWIMVFIKGGAQQCSPSGEIERDPGTGFEEAQRGILHGGVGEEPHQRYRKDTQGRKSLARPRRSEPAQAGRGPTGPQCEWKCTAPLPKKRTNPEARFDRFRYCTYPHIRGSQRTTSGRYVINSRTPIWITRNGRTALVTQTIFLFTMAPVM